jgi:hypothetical protein
MKTITIQEGTSRVVGCKFQVTCNYRSETKNSGTTHEAIGEEDVIAIVEHFLKQPE